MNSTTEITIFNLAIIIGKVIYGVVLHNFSPNLNSRLIAVVEIQCFPNGVLTQHIPFVSEILSRNRNITRRRYGAPLILEPSPQDENVPS